MANQQIALGKPKTTAEEASQPSNGTLFEAGEKATLSPQGAVINRGQLTANEYKALVLNHLLDKTSSRGQCHQFDLPKFVWPQFTGLDGCNRSQLLIAARTHTHA